MVASIQDLRFDSDNMICLVAVSPVCLPDMKPEAQLKEKQRYAERKKDVATRDLELRITINNIGHCLRGFGDIAWH